MNYRCILLKKLPSMLAANGSFTVKMSNSILEARSPTVRTSPWKTDPSERTHCAGRPPGPTAPSRPQGRPEEAVAPCGALPGGSYLGVGVPADDEADRSRATFPEDGVGLAESGVTETDRVHLQDLIPTTVGGAQAPSETSLNRVPYIIEKHEPGSPSDPHEQSPVPL